jgi:hypothetical protein
MEGDLVLTTDEAIEYFKNLQAHLLRIHPARKDKSDQGGERLESSAIGAI